LEFSRTFAAHDRIIVVRWIEHHFHAAFTISKQFLYALQVHQDLPIQPEEFFRIKLYFKPIEAFLQRKIASFSSSQERVLLQGMDVCDLLRLHQFEMIAIADQETLYQRGWPHRFLVAGK